MMSYNMRSISVHHDLQVVKSNHIISASYRLSVAEQRVILCCIAQVRRDGPVTDEILYSVRVADIAEITHSDPKSAYRDLAAAAERLFERRLTVLYEPDGSSRMARKRLTRWVQTVDYIEAEGRVELRFSKDILPFLTGLTQQFTRYQLSAVAKMTSSHAIRLFELLAQYGSVGTREVSLEDLRKWFELEASYPSIKDLKLRVIEPAVSQINLHSPLRVTWSQRKTGRRVSHLTFKFEEKKRQVRPTMKKAKSWKDLSPSELSNLARPGESHADFMTRIKQEMP